MHDRIMLPQRYKKTQYGKLRLANHLVERTGCDGELLAAVSFFPKDEFRAAEDAGF